MIHVMVAEDETMLRRLLVRRLGQEQDLRVVGEAENGRDAVDMAIQSRPDVVVMDLNLPVLSGAFATERILSHLPHVKVIILTALTELAPVARQFGAFDWLDMSRTPEDLIATIRKATTQQEPMATVEPHFPAVQRLTTRHKLTEYEEKVLDMMVRTEWTLRQIASELSTSTGSRITESSVKHALERILTKLHVQPRTRTALMKHVLHFMLVD
jgi:NarL family two-component system response regulator LiaR